MALSDIGQALSGFSAGLQGRGVEFAQGLRDQERMRMQQEQHRTAQQQAQQQLLEQRARIAYQDASSALNFANSGRFDQILALGGSRMQASGAFPDADMTDTKQVMQLAKMAQEGKQGAAERLKAFLTDQVEVGRAMGFLEQAPQRKLVKTEDGRATFLNPDMTVSEEAIQGAVARAGDKLKFSDFRGVQKDVTAMIKDASDIRSAASRLDKISKTKSATDQLAAIFTFMKALDPGSVVRENEQDQAVRTGGITDQFAAYIDQIRGKGALPENVFNEMVMTAKRLSNQASEDTRADVLGYLDGFGDRLKQEDKDRLIARSPALFDMPKPIQTVQEREPQDFTGFKLRGIR